jgi:CTP:molybdopterin cytidylyltransferase MocA
MNGLILAGGDGSRLAADGVSQPKTLVEVHGRPLLAALVETLCAIGCETVTCMVPHARVSALVPLLTQPATRLFGCATPSSLHTLVEGLNRIPDGAVFCTMVDTVMPRKDWKRLFSSVAGDLASGAGLVLAVTPHIDDERPLYVTQDAAGNVLDVGDTPGEPVRVTGGVYGFSVAARFAATEAARTGMQRMRGFLRSSIRSGLATRAIEVPMIIDLDHASDLAAANAWLAVAEN